MSKTIDWIAGGLSQFILRRVHVSIWSSCGQVGVWTWYCIIVFLFLIIPWNPGSITLKWDTLRVIYLPLRRAVIIIPFICTTLNGKGSKRVESLFLCRASIVSPMLIVDVFALSFLCVFILTLALSSFSLTFAPRSDNWLVCPDGSCGSLFRTLQLKSNSAGANPVVLCGVVL